MLSVADYQHLHLRQVSLPSEHLQRQAINDLSMTLLQVDCILTLMAMRLGLLR
ncbi:MAG: hypothetical protein V7K15_11780 [Nostoc sp.]